MHVKFHGENISSSRICTALCFGQEQNDTNGKVKQTTLAKVTTGTMQIRLHPGKLTWNPKVEVWNMRPLLERVTCRRFPKDLFGSRNDVCSHRECWGLWDQVPQNQQTIENGRFSDPNLSGSLENVHLYRSKTLVGFVGAIFADRSF